MTKAELTESVASKVDLPRAIAERENLAPNDARHRQP